jgi:hypothetical protein
MYVAVYGRLSMWAPLTSKSTPRGEADMVFGGMGRRLALVRTWKAAIHQRVACATARSMCLPLLLSPSRSHTRLLRYLLTWLAFGQEPVTIPHCGHVVCRACVPPAKVRRV